MKRFFAGLSALCSVMIFGACSGPHVDSSAASSSLRKKIIGMPNPAATYCIAQKGTLEPRIDSKGNTTSYCHLKNGEVVEEWAFYRKNHQK